MKTKKVMESFILCMQWMPLEEYAAQTCAQEQGLRNYITDLCMEKLERDYSGFSPFEVPSDSNGNPPT